MSRLIGGALQAICLSHSSVGLPAHSSCFTNLCDGTPVLKTFFNVYVLLLIWLDLLTVLESNSLLGAHSSPGKSIVNYACQEELKSFTTRYGWTLLFIFACFGIDLSCDNLIPWMIFYQTFSICWIEFLDRFL